jgi:hypothetical protein
MIEGFTSKECVRCHAQTGECYDKIEVVTYNILSSVQASYYYSAK